MKHIDELGALIYTIGCACDSLKKCSDENYEDVECIITMLEKVYTDYASKYAAMLDKSDK